MSVFKRGDRWWYEFEFRGQRVRESTGSDSKTLAIRTERQHRRELEESANGVRAARRPVLFPIAAREWMAANRARWSESNVSIQEFNLKHLSGYFGSMLLSDISPQHIGKYQGIRQNEGASNRTINMEVSTLRMMMKAARLWSAISDDVRMLPERRDVGRALTPDEEKKLLEACRKSTQPALYPAVVIFCNTGLRNAELRRARWNQVDFIRAEFRVGKAKTAGSEGRIIPLNQAALGAFKEWKSHWPDAQSNHYIFPTEKLAFKGESAPGKGVMTVYAVNPGKPLGGWKRAWSTAKKFAGVECRIHDLRHHFISALAQTQTTDATIQAISGHLSRKMLEHYSHVRLEAKRRAVEALDTMTAQRVQ